MEHINITTSLLKEFYNLGNYKVIDTPTQNKQKRAVIYCSSNALYDNKKSLSHEDIILKNNRFEWSRNLLKDFDRHIFIRDIHVFWYQKGINNRVNSIPKLIDLMRELTQGYEITTLGVSAGGYIAMLLGSELKAHKVLSFAGQIDVLDFIKHINKKQKIDASQIVPEYANIKDHISPPRTDIFYFASILDENDRENIRLAGALRGIKLFSINNNKHHMPVDKIVISNVINSDKPTLLKLWQKYDGKIIKTESISKDLLGFSYYFKKLFKRHIKKKIDM